MINFSLKHTTPTTMSLKEYSSFILLLSFVFLFSCASAFTTKRLGEVSRISRVHKHSSVFYSMDDPYEDELFFIAYNKEERVEQPAIFISYKGIPSINNYIWTKGFETMYPIRIKNNDPSYQPGSQFQIAIQAAYEFQHIDFIVYSMNSGINILSSTEPKLFAFVPKNDILNFKYQLPPKQNGLMFSTASADRNKYAPNLYMDVDHRPYSRHATWKSEDPSVKVQEIYVQKSDHHFKQEANYNAAVMNPKYDQIFDISWVNAGRTRKINESSSLHLDINNDEYLFFHFTKPNVKTVTFKVWAILKYSQVKLSADTENPHPTVFHNEKYAVGHGHQSVTLNGTKSGQYYLGVRQLRDDVVFVFDVSVTAK